MFVEALQISIALRTAEHQHRVAGASVKRCALELRPHGFSGAVTFWSVPGEKDTLIDWFVGPALMTVELTVDGARPEQAPARIVLAGLATDKEVRETVAAGVAKTPVGLREYTVRFVDAAAHLWRQHFPLELRAAATMKETIAGHLANGMALDITLDDADATRPLVCVPTGDGGASFYDFVLWYAERAGGCFQYDYFAKRYRLAKKRQAQAATQRLRAREVASLCLRLPEPARFAPRVLNAHSEAAHVDALAQPDAVTGLVRDRLVRTPRPADVDAQKQIEGDRLRAPHPELEVELAALPEAPLMPGAETGLAKGDFSDALSAAGKSFRVAALSLAAEVADGAHPQRNDGQRRAYRVSLRARWESAADERARLPAYAPPVWPVVVEGKIVSEIGGAHDRTFMADEDKETTLSYYVVHVPLWNQKIKVAFTPQFLPGHFFAPAFKESRVLLALGFEQAEIVQFLDWGPDVQLPAESQGNHLLFGKNKTSQTSLKHVYVDDKPVLSLSRVQEADQGRLQLEEGTLVLEIKEDPSAQGGGETHDLSAEVAASNAKLESGAQASIDKVKAQSAKGKSGLDARLGDARANLSGSLESLDGEVSGKVADGKGELEGCLGAVDDKVAALQTDIGDAIGELSSKRGGA